MYHRPCGIGYEQGRLERYWTAKRRISKVCSPSLLDESEKNSRLLLEMWTMTDSGQEKKDDVRKE